MDPGVKDYPFSMYFTSFFQYSHGRIQMLNDCQTSESLGRVSPTSVTRKMKKGSFVRTLQNNSFGHTSQNTTTRVVNRDLGFVVQ